MCLPTTSRLSQDVVPTHSPPTRPFSIKRGGHLDAGSQVQIIEYSKDDYLIISHEGVFEAREDEYDFMTLENWEENYNLHCKLMRIPFFARFKMWKPFYFWRTKVRAKKTHLARESLRYRLVFVNKVCDCLFVSRSGIVLNLL